MIARPAENYLAHRLRGVAVFLSASVPDRAIVRTNFYQGPLPTREQIPDQDLRIETAVTALARAVFRSGGQLVFGGHPAISPHVAMVAAEYFRPLPPSGEEPCDAEAAYAQPIVVFQSEAYRDVIIEEVRFMERLGQAKICWTAPVNDEKFDPKLIGQKQCQDSLKSMREQMVARKNVEAMVCIGGMDGILDEYEEYAKSGDRRPAYVLHSTGGASAILANLRSPALEVDVVDRRIMDQWSVDAAEFPPYDAIAQSIIDELAPDNGSTPLPDDSPPPDDGPSPLPPRADPNW